MGVFISSEMHAKQKITNTQNCNEKNHVVATLSLSLKYHSPFRGKKGTSLRQKKKKHEIGVFFTQNLQKIRDKRWCFQSLGHDNPTVHRVPWIGSWTLVTVSKTHHDDK